MTKATVWQSKINAAEWSHTTPDKYSSFCFLSTIQINNMLSHLINKHAQSFNKQTFINNHHRYVPLSHQHRCLRSHLVDLAHPKAMLSLKMNSRKTTLRAQKDSHQQVSNSPTLCLIHLH